MKTAFCALMAMVGGAVFSACARDVAHPDSTALVVDQEQPDPVQLDQLANESALRDLNVDIERRQRTVDRRSLDAIAGAHIDYPRLIQLSGQLPGATPHDLVEMELELVHAGFDVDETADGQRLLGLVEDVVSKLGRQGQWRRFISDVLAPHRNSTHIVLSELVALTDIPNLDFGEEEITHQYLRGGVADTYEQFEQDWVIDARGVSLQSWLETIYAANCRGAHTLQLGEYAQNRGIHDGPASRPDESVIARRMSENLRLVRLRTLQ